MQISENLLEKWKVLIQACIDYYINSVPTGMSDSEFDELELRAIKEDNFFARDYVFQTYLKGNKTQNNYIEKIKKTKVEGSMLSAIQNLNHKYALLKYDGSSIAIYLDPKTGKPLREVTVGNQNLDSLGVDQTYKLHRFLPKRFPKGITAIQCEALVDIDRLPKDFDPERARQKANGLINSKLIQDEVDQLLTLRAYRYYTDDTPDGIAIRETDFKTVLESFETIYADDNHILFSPADIFTVDELTKAGDYCETDHTRTSTGYFLNDGWVLYDEHGICQGALKFSGAGSSSDGIIKTKVLGVQWNDQTPKGKDSWSANILIEPVTLKGSVVKKPSAGSVKKLVDKKITPGAEVSVVLANSTIPMIGESFTEGDGNFNWPVCGCGYHMSEKDVFGSLLKCGNPCCSTRLDRMRGVLNSYSDVSKELDLNKFLALDRFKWEQTDIKISTLLSFIESNNASGYYEYLKSFLKTDLQRRNLDLVYGPSFEALTEVFLRNVFKN